MPEPIKINNIKFNIEIQTQNEGEDFLIVEGTASTNSKDSDGDICLISPVALKEYIADHKQIDIDVDHSYFSNRITGEFSNPQNRAFKAGQDKWQNEKYQDRIIGQVLELEYTPKDITFDSIDLENMPKIVMKHKSKIMDKEAIEDIKNGKLTGFSLMWSGQKFQAGKNILLYSQLDLVMLTITSAPKNDDCNDLAIADKQENKKQKGVEFKAKVKQEVVGTQEVDIARGKELMVAIEHKKGQERFGKDLVCDYGYIIGYAGEDKMELDCYLGTDLTGGKIFKIFQVNKDTLEFDESKIMLGFGTVQEARKAYLEAVDQRMYNGIVEINYEELLKYRSDKVNTNNIKVNIIKPKPANQIKVNGVIITFC